VRSDDGAPVDAAAVGWDSAQGTVRAWTTATGDVLLDGVPPGAGTLTVTAEGFRPIERDVTAAPDVPQGVRLTPKPPSSIVVHVSDWGGVPIADAVVYLDVQDAADDDQVAVTDPDGDARFEVRRPGRVLATAWASGYARASESMALREDADVPLSITLRPGLATP
jgi:hypothetical protein